MPPIPIGLIGAVQRMSPPVAAIWLQWSGVPDADKCVFDVAGDSRAAMSVIHVSPWCVDVERTRTKLADFMRLPRMAPERRTVPIRIGINEPWNAAFWARVVRRDARKLPSPLEFWWMLACIRHGGVVRTSTLALKALGVKSRTTMFTGCALELVNPTFRANAQTLADAMAGAYAQPTNLNVYLQVDAADSHIHRGKSLITIPLKEDTRDKVAGAIMSLALSTDILEELA
jgi:hypothetical protein